MKGAGRTALEKLELLAALLVTISGLNLAVLAATRVVLTFLDHPEAMGLTAGYAALPLRAFAAGHLGLLALAAALRIALGRTRVVRSVGVAPGPGVAHEGYFATVLVSAVALVLSLAYATTLAAPFDAASAPWRFAAATGASAAGDARLAAWRWAAEALGPGAFGLRFVVVGLLGLAALGLAAFVRALGWSAWSAWLAAVLYAAHPYHALAAGSPAFGLSRLPEAALAALALWQAARARRPGARPMGMLTAAAFAVVCAWNARLWPLALAPLALEILDPRRGEAIRALGRVAPAALVAAAAAWLAPAAGAWFGDLPALARLAVSPLGNLSADALPARGGTAGANWLLGRGTAAVDMLYAFAALAGATLVVLRRELHPKVLVLVALLALALAAPAPGEGAGAWIVAGDPRHGRLALPAALLWAYALAGGAGAGRGLRGAGAALGLVLVVGHGLIAYRSAAAAADVAGAAHRFVEDFDRWARPRLRPNGLYAFVGVPRLDRGLPVASPESLAADFGRRVPGLEDARWITIAPGVGAPIADFDPRRVAWGRRALASRWDGAARVQQDLTMAVIDAVEVPQRGPERVFDADEIDRRWRTVRTGGPAAGVRFESPDLALATTGLGEAVLRLRGAADARAAFAWRCRGDAVEWRAPFGPWADEGEGGLRSARAALGRSLPWLVCAEVESLAVEASGAPGEVRVESLSIGPADGAP